MHLSMSTFRLNTFRYLPTSAYSRSTLATSALTMLTSFVLSGCFSYQTATPPIPEDAMVRVILTLRGQGLASEAVGAPRTELVGTILERPGEAFLVSVPQIEIAGVSAAGPTWTQVLLPREGISQIQTRRVNVPATAGIVGFASVALYLLIVTKLNDPGCCQ